MEQRRAVKTIDDTSFVVLIVCPSFEQTSFGGTNKEGSVEEKVMLFKHLDVPFLIKG